MSGRNTAGRTRAIRRLIGRLLLAVIGAAMFWPAAASSAQGAAEPIDIVIVNGVVIDGTGVQRRRAEVGISGDRIAYVGTRPARIRPLRTIDARGRFVVPGFIDPHTHSGSDALSDDPKRRALTNHLLQGVTSIVFGNDGGGTPDVAGTMARAAAQAPGTNIASFVGFGAVRRRRLGDDNRAPTAAELADMQALVGQAMCDGALGLSAGLYYAPQSFARTDEVVALARAAAARGGLYETHLRDEGSASIGFMPAVNEAIAIAGQAGLPLHIAHIKLLGVDAQGGARALIDRIEQAQAGGMRISADQYPWTASSTGLSAALVPRSAMAGGDDAMVSRLRVADDRMRSAMAEQLRIRGGPGAVLLVEGRHAGQRLDTLARTWATTPVDAAIRILIDEPDVSIASFNMAEADIALLTTRPWVMTSSDATEGHPRRWGSFARRWRLYVREAPLLTPEAFVHRSAGLTAATLGLDGRGLLVPGGFADVVVLDPAHYGERASYTQPDTASVGVSHVIVNGRLAVADGQPTGQQHGRGLVRPRQPSWACPAPAAVQHDD
jgi:N-acyl-D-aspartate/D-glutamate deacylase